MTAETIHTCSYSCERPECIRAQRDELASRVTAPPPAAARGGVRGLVAKWREESERDLRLANKLRESGDRDVADLRLGYATVQHECADELEAALAAEGVQAGAALRDALAYVGQRTDGDLPTLAERCELWMRESHSLIENPVHKAKAQGVVDVEAIRRACQSGKQFWKAGHGYYEEIESLLPALTGERNG